MVSNANTRMAMQKETYDGCTLKLRKFSSEAFHTENYFTYYCEFVNNIFSKIVGERFKM